jgi:glycosyltransferase involved in cell wall biosynthesis
VPLINNKYWSYAVRKAGHDSVTLVTHHYPAYKREDFDVYYEDLVHGPFARYLGKLGVRIREFAAFGYILRHARVLHISFEGGPLGRTPYWRLEASLLRRAGIRTIVIPYGGDAHQYSQILNTPVRHALLADYPHAARREPEIRERVDYWSRHADCVICAALIYGMSRWDVTTPSVLALDVDAVRPKTAWSNADGRDAPVRVIHTPNHRTYKGTEFLENAVVALCEEGLRVELIVLQNVPNDRILRELSESDIMVEQLNAGSYGLSAIEAMAAGLPVISNLEDPARSSLFRRYAFLDECPIVSSTPEQVVRDLRTLVTNPGLRKSLGAASREYVVKYHSLDAAAFLFTSVYKRILDGETIDLMNLYHPLKSEYSRRLPRVEHPLVAGHLPIVEYRPTMQ